MMDKEKLNLWIERLNKAKEKDHEKIVAAMAKENNLNIDEALQLLKSNGFDPKGEPPKENSQDKTESKKQSVVLRHKTEYPKYRRAGLVLTQKTETYEVTDEQLALLKKDPWVVIGEGKKDGADK